MKVFIGCSSSDNISNEYFEDCKNLLEQLLNDNDLIFGACNSGLMGLTYNTAINHGRNICGVCPEAYKEDFKLLKCNSEITTNSVSERTKEMIELSDALVFLPGGIGTIYELFTAIESKRCYEFDKPIIIYNSNGFFDKMLEFMEKAYIESFSKTQDKNNYLVTSSPREVLYYLNNYQKIKENEKKFGMPYESFSKEYKKTNGFQNEPELIGMPDFFNDDNTTNNCEKKSNAVKKYGGIHGKRKNNK